VSEADPIVRRLQIGGLVWCLATAGLAVAIWPGRPEIAAGIVGGGALAGVSFLAIKSGTDALLGLMPNVAAPGSATQADEAGDEALTPMARRRIAVGALGKMTGRYALLAVLAYVMIARLRLHPIGLVVGASSLVVAATVEAARWLARPIPRASR
jgi:hypothetical protein